MKVATCDLHAVECSGSGGSDGRCAGGRLAGHSAPLRAGQLRDGLGAVAAIDETRPDSPSLQDYTVFEIDESLTAPLVKWLSKKPG
jgi:hypothetical protein